MGLKETLWQNKRHKTILIIFIYAVISAILLYIEQGCVFGTTCNGALTTLIYAIFSPWLFIHYVADNMFYMDESLPAYGFLILQMIYLAILTCIVRYIQRRVQKKEKTSIDFKGFMLKYEEEALTIFWVFIYAVISVILYLIFDACFATGGPDICENIVFIWALIILVLVPYYVVAYPFDMLGIMNHDLAIFLFVLAIIVEVLYLYLISRGIYYIYKKIRKK